MMASFLRLISSVCLLMILRAVSGATAGGVSADSTGSNREGLVFSAEYRPQKVFLDGKAGTGTASSFSVGYLLSQSWQAELKIYAGAQSIHAGHGRPLTGYPLLGGAGVEATHTFCGGGSIHPYAGCGFGFFNLLAGGIGYAGSGPHLVAGVHYDLSKFFAVRGGISYGWIRYYGLSGEFPPSTAFTPFSVSIVAANLSLSFYPNILP